MLNTTRLREFDFPGLVFGPLISFVDITLCNAQISLKRQEKKSGNFIRRPLLARVSLLSEELLITHIDEYTRLAVTVLEQGGQRQ